jgi:hypothetical protein
MDDLLTMICSIEVSHGALLVKENERVLKIMKISHTPTCCAMCTHVLYYSLYILIVVIFDFLDIFDHLSYSKYFYKNHIFLCFVLLLKKVEISPIILNI